MPELAALLTADHNGPPTTSQQPSSEVLTPLYAHPRLSQYFKPKPLKKYNNS